jgi:hypothetical protein
MAKAEFLIADALKAQQWERAKGELRALVALQGSYTSPYPDHVDKEKEHHKKWEALQARVEEFITAVEDDGLQE